MFAKQKHRGYGVNSLIPHQTNHIVKTRVEPIMDTQDRSQEELLSEVEQIVETLTVAGGIQNYVANETEDGAKMQELSRSALSDAVIIVTCEKSDPIATKAIEGMAVKLSEINKLVLKHINLRLAHLGALLIKMPASEWVDFDDVVTDGELVKTAAEGVKNSGLKLPKDAMVAGIKPKGPLLELLGHFVDMTGGPEKFIKHQIASASVLPPEIVGTHAAIIATMTGAISGAAHERAMNVDTAMTTISTLLSTVHAARDMLTLPTLSAAVSFQDLARFVAESMPHRLKTDVEDDKATYKAAKAEKPGASQVVTEPRKTAQILEFPQSNTVH